MRSFSISDSGYTIGVEVGNVSGFNEQLADSLHGVHFFITEEATDTVVYEEIVDLDHEEGGE